MFRAVVGLGLGFGSKWLPPHRDKEIKNHARLQALSGEVQHKIPVLHCVCV